MNIRRSVIVAGAFVALCIVTAASATADATPGADVTGEVAGWATIAVNLVVALVTIAVSARSAARTRRHERAMKERELAVERARVDLDARRLELDADRAESEATDRHFTQLVKQVEVLGQRLDQSEADRRAEREELLEEIRSCDEGRREQRKTIERQDRELATLRARVALLEQQLAGVPSRAPRT
jgi:DNA-binding response OmpR family regulator